MYRQDCSTRHPAPAQTAVNRIQYESKMIEIAVIMPCERTVAEAHRLQ